MYYRKIYTIMFELFIISLGSLFRKIKVTDWQY